MISKKKRSSPKFKGFFRPKSEIQGFVSDRNQKLKSFFRPIAGDLQKKKFPPKFKLVFLAEIRNSRVFFGRIRNSKSFSGRNQVISKNRSLPTLGELLNQKTPLFWSKQRQFHHNFGSKISLGGEGLFHFWSKNRPQKH